MENCSHDEVVAQGWRGRVLHWVLSSLFQAVAQDEVVQSYHDPNL